MLQHSTQWVSGHKWRPPAWLTMLALALMRQKKWEKKEKRRKERKAEGKQKLTTLWHGNETASGLSGRRESQTGPAHNMCEKGQQPQQREICRESGSQSGRERDGSMGWSNLQGEQGKDNSNSALLPLFCLMLHVKLSC